MCGDTDEVGGRWKKGEGEFWLLFGKRFANRPNPTNRQTHGFGPRTPPPPPIATFGMNLEKILFSSLVLSPVSSKLRSVRGQLYYHRIVILRTLTQE